MEGFSFYSPFSSVAVYGGSDGNVWDVQKRGLTRGADVVIATPGRLLSHMNVYKIDFSAVKYFILDEADRMLDMGFFDDILKIVSSLPRNRQTIMFSATMPDELRRLAKGFMRNPVEVNIAVSRPPETIHQQACICYDMQKLPLVKRLLRGYGLKTTGAPLRKVLLFVGKKANVKDIYIALRKDGFEARQMHSDLTQPEREQVMLDFRNGKVDVLVATDIVARGIDVDDIPLVINYDVPRDVEDYVHRIGRTARAENSGEAVTLVNEKDQLFFLKIERFLKKSIDRLPVPEELGEAPAFNPRTPEKKRRSFRRKPGKGKPKQHSSKSKTAQSKPKQ